ncbi:PilT/PilU family type 4a pilus ATPase [Candidatus Peregrinibacteria bacterium]|nr:PilT/PilU family type 4a pilus ATPase [Candidatus Peregrinibacteria bacterium]
MPLNLDPLIELAINQNATDIHLQTGHKAVLRINGKLLLVEDSEPFQLNEGTREFEELLNEKQYAYFKEYGSVDFAFTHNVDVRLRGNLFRRQDGLTLSLRIVRNKILTFDQLNLPPVFKDMAENYRQGFFLIVGPTGQGKTTSIASIINYINDNRSEHIVTIEDPIEYIIHNNKSVVEQREIGTHASSFENALRASMRQDPDIIVIGEMRDQETMQAAITLAETGHLVFSTMHTNNSVQTIDRIIDAFPEHKQKQIRIQLSSTLSGVVSQRLVPGIKGELVFAYEQMLMTDAVRNIIRSEKVEQIYNALQSDNNGQYVRLEQCLANLAIDKKITRDMALSFASNRELIEMFESYNK